MRSIRDFFYYNRKVLLIILCLFFGYVFMNNIEKKEEVIIEEIKPSVFMVDIKGAVKNPGIYKVEEGKRIVDIIEMSGGLLEKADITSINLSEKVKDEMVIFIPKKEEAIVEEFNDKKDVSSSIKKEIINSKISINTGTLNDLMKVKGIGEVKAKSIIDYRIKNGNFKKLEDIMKVKGIGEATFNKIKDSIKL